MMKKKHANFYMINSGSFFSGTGIEVILISSEATIQIRNGQKHHYTIKHHKLEEI